MGKNTLIKNTNTKKVVVDFPNADPQDRALYTLAASMYQNATFSLPHRARLASAAGQSFGGNRDLYNSLGYIKDPQFEDFYNRYERGDIAKRIVSAYSEATWRGVPEVMENDDPTETEFEKAWNQMVLDFNIYHYLKRIDTLSGIGRYGVLLIGIDDGLDLDQPVGKSKGLLYLRPYMENHATIEKYVEDSTDQRFGLPEYYKISIMLTKHGSAATGSIEASATNSRMVHHSRVLHIAEDLMEDDIFAVPRLKSVLNRLHDMDLISGGSAEMFWRGGFPGYAFNIPADVPAAQINTTEMTDQIENYVHDLKRYMKLQGVEISSLAQQVANPEANFKVLLRLISAATGIPARILTGSERGQLASEQDETNWNNRVEERMENYATPMILRPFINKLIDAAILPEVDYEINWPSMFELDEQDAADVNKKYAETIAAYVNAQGGDALVPPDLFRKKYLGFTEDENKQADAYMEEALAKEAEEAETEKKEQREFEQGGEDEFE